MAQPEKATPAHDDAAQPPVADGTTPPSPPDAPKTFLGKYPRWVYGTAASAAVLSAGAVEMQTSFVQSHVFNRIAEGRLFSRVRTSSPTMAAPAVGPYDERLGYTRSLDFRRRLTERGYVVTGETQWTERNVLGIELYPIYNSRSQAGLRIIDDTNSPLYIANYPSRSFENFDNIPPVLTNSLLFVENRELLGQHNPNWNPAIEWVRLARAFSGQALGAIGMPQDRAGGSTLATQIEKFRHSPRGITGGATEKFRQMLTATVRAYGDGTDTRDERQDIVLAYLNSMPLSAYPGFGEVNGFADGMSLWFDADMNEVNRLLRTPDAQLSPAEMQRKAVAYRQALSLVMAVKKPSAYLLRDHAELNERVNSYLPLLAEAGIISPQMRDMVLRTPLVFSNPATHARLRPQPPSKPVQSLRVELMQSLGMRDMYDLNRVDMTARTTMDAQANEAVTNRLRSLRDPAVAAQNGLIGHRLLSPSMTQDITYSFNLYERMPDGTNVLRVQTDNYDGALNLNEGSKLELGSTAKLRTMSTYLQIISEIHARYSSMTPDQLRGVRQNDTLTRWTVNHLMTAADRSLDGTLRAAMNREYSGNPGESFYTGGGLHSFVNFEGQGNGRSYTVSAAFTNSVNLPFVRMMRDIVEYTRAEEMNVDPAVFTDVNNPQRRQYLERFAQREGELFMHRAWRQQRNVAPNGLAALLAGQTRGTPTQLAVIFRSLHPNASQANMEAFMRANCSTCGDNTNFSRLYNDYGPGKFSLNDRAYLTRLHPMALWLAEQRVQNPQMTWEQALARSAQTRVDIYSWLINSNNTGGQNNRIHTIIEEEAFTHITRRWQAMGFPFERMTPSYASALGASGDTPAALATLAGIIQNDGMRSDSIRFREITMGAGTPYELTYRRPTPQAVRVLPAEATRILRTAMQSVVENGTAVRARGAITLSNGTVLPLGGKTGTGDNRLGEEVRSRTATFVFLIDDRFYGTITAYVDGPTAANYRFTSSLSSQIFRTISSDIQPLLDRSYAVTPRIDPNAVVTPPVAPIPVPTATPELPVTPDPTAVPPVTITFNTPAAPRQPAPEPEDTPRAPPPPAPRVDEPEAAPTPLPPEPTAPPPEPTVDETPVAEPVAPAPAEPVPAAPPVTETPSETPPETPPGETTTAAILPPRNGGGGASAPRA